MLQTLAFGQYDAINLVYLLAAVLFIFGLKLLSSVKTAWQGNLVSAVGMLIAAAATFFFLTGGQLISLVWVAIALAIGAGVGLALAIKVPMTGMPQMVGLLNGFGGIASLLVATGEYFHTRTEIAEAAATATELSIATVPEVGFIWYGLLATGLATLIGGVTFTGSLIAFGKLQGVSWVPDQPVQFPGQKVLIGLLLAVSLALSFLLIWEPALPLAWPVWAIAVAGLVLGILLVIGIGGADMPVVVSLLNSYSGLAAAMAGFVLNNYALIITGSLVGASGLILTSIMCKAMNRSLANVLFGGVGGKPKGGAAAGGGPQGEAREFTAEDAAMVMEAANQVIFVPGYGMAVAQAQHAVKELVDELEERGVGVKFAIHPVAGRMPGHMNVLLAEAGIPYEQLLDLDQVNPEFERTDVALVIGANDVTNPAARHDESSPIFGMPILDVDKAKNVFVIKRSLNPGFAGIQNELYFKDNTGMIFGDAKKVVTDLVAEIDEL
ncbi:MAG: NAD(P)(+) transhydrogenase (Re/Si-specific) subunit beta [Phycisphaeraceae bacterium]